MTIHSEHPFLPPDGERDPIRQFRGRMAAPVTVWATGADRQRHGLTISSVLIVDGDRPQVIAVIDPDSDFWTSRPKLATVNLLSGHHRYLADAFARTVPAPGGPFTIGDWEPSPWGPVLTDGSGWLGIGINGDARTLGYSVVVEAEIEKVVIGTGDPLVHVRGRYLDVGPNQSGRS